MTYMSGYNTTIIAIKSTTSSKNSTAINYTTIKIGAIGESNVILVCIVLRMRLFLLHCYNYAEVLCYYIGCY